MSESFSEKAKLAVQQPVNANESQVQVINDLEAAHDDRQKQVEKLTEENARLIVDKNGLRSQLVKLEKAKANLEVKCYDRMVAIRKLSQEIYSLQSCRDACCRSQEACERHELCEDVLEQWQEWWSKMMRPAIVMLHDRVEDVFSKMPPYPEFPIKISEKKGEEE